MEENNLILNDIKQIAQLHVNALPNDIFPSLGKWYLTHYYKFVISSIKDDLILLRNENNIDAVCVITYSSTDFISRVVKATFFPLFISAVLSFFTSNAFRHFFISFIKSKIIKNDTHGFGKNMNPEIAFIYTDTKKQGQGLGTKLLSKVKTLLLDKHITELFVKTLDHPSNKALNFYLKIGFKPIGQLTQLGRNYTAFKLYLSNK